MALRIVTATAAGLMALPALAQTQGYPGHGYGEHMWGGGWHGWFLGPLMMLAWLAVVVGAVVLLVRLFGAREQAGTAKPGPDAMNILRERFARGEIDKAEFEERRALLEK